MSSARSHPPRVILSSRSNVASLDGRHRRLEALVARRRHRRAARPARRSRWSACRERSADVADLQLLQGRRTRCARDSRGAASRRARSPQADDRIEAPGVGQRLGEQRDLERAGDMHHFDVVVLAPLCCRPRSAPCSSRSVTTLLKRDTTMPKRRPGGVEPAFVHLGHRRAQRPACSPENRWPSFCCLVRR